jgi:hypothetical protein
MSDSVNNTPGTSTPDTAKLSPDVVITQLRTMRSQIDEVAPLSKEQRKQLKQRLRNQPKTVVETAINVLGALTMSQAIGQPLDEVRQLQDDSIREAVATRSARS